MVDLYGCGGCGAVLHDVSSGRCGACGHEPDGEFEEIEVGDSEEHECDECGRTFDTERGLSTHQRSHEE